MNWSQWIVDTFPSVFDFRRYNPFARIVATMFAPCISWDYNHDLRPPANDNRHM